MLLAAAPVVLVNVVAFSGQLAFLRDHLPWVPAGQVLMAVTLETIAVYLAWQAHLAQLANDSALRLRLAAYGFALLIAAMNYSHYAGPGWRPTFVAVAVALCSAASPWLWGVHTRRTSRDRLMAAGLVEPHALRLGGTRWAWHPVRSVRVMSAATWQGITDPAKAIGAAYPPDADDERGRDGAGRPVPATQTASPGVSAGVSLPGVREIQRRRNCSPTTAKKIRAELAAYERSRGGVTEPSHRAATVPAAHVPAGVPPQASQPAPAGASPNGQAAHA